MINEPALRLRGHSKSKRRDLPQVVLEAVVGADHGLIVHHQAHPGNTNDLSLAPDAAGALAQLGYREVEWVADCGLNTAKSRDSLRAERFEFVLGEGVCKTAAAKAMVRSKGPMQPHPEKPHLCYRALVQEVKEGRKKRKRLYVLRLNKRKRKEDLRRIGGHLERVREALSRGEKEAAELLGHPILKRYVRRSAHKRDGKGRPIGKVLLDRKKIADARRNAGKSVIGTDVLTKDPVEVDEVYRSLFKIEEAFRCLKSTVKLGPIRHRRADRIQAHLSLAVMAFNLGRWLRHKSGMTLERLQRVFANARVQKVKIGTAEYWERVNLEKEQLAVLGKMGYAIPPKRFTVAVTR